MSQITRLSRRKKVCFAGITTIGFFLLVEAALIIVITSPRTEFEDPYVGFASWSPVFVEQTNEAGQVVMRTAENKRPWFNHQEFPRRKPAETCRIFCLGGSTTYGHPYDDATSFAGWLRELLPRADGSKTWEVINAGGISYASYRVARLMEELIEYEPDLFVIYCGHNEFLEHRTYASLAETPATVRNLDTLLSRTRTYSLLRNLLKGSDQEDQAARKSLLPAEVDAILDRSIGPEIYERDDPLREQIIAHFEMNLNRMIEIAGSAGAQVIFVTPPSNIRDFSPFKSQFDVPTSSADRRRIAGWLSRAEEALTGGNAGEALEYLDQVLPLDDRFAEAWFLRGRALLGVGDFPQAREAFLRAREEDVCPLRALTPICNAVRHTAESRKVPLVDFVQIAEQQSEHSIPGDNLFLDHVHPTIEGNKMVALAIIDSMSEAKMMRPGKSWDDSAIQRVTDLVEQRTDREAHARALINLAKVLGWAGKQAESSRVALKAVELLPEDLEAQYEAGNAYFSEGQLDEAERFYQQASKINANYAPAHYGLGLVQSARGKPAEAAAHFQDAVALDPNFSEAHYNLGNSLMELKDYAGAERSFRQSIHLSPEYRYAYNNLGVLEVIRGNSDQAMSWFQQAIEVDPLFADAHANLGHLFEDKGNKASALKHYRKALQAEPNHRKARQFLSRLENGDE